MRLYELRSSVYTGDLRAASQSSQLSRGWPPPTINAGWRPMRAVHWLRPRVTACLISA